MNDNDARKLIRTLERIAMAVETVNRIQWRRDTGDTTLDAEIGERLGMPAEDKPLHLQGPATRTWWPGVGGALR